MEPRILTLILSFQPSHAHSSHCKSFVQNLAYTYIDIDIYIDNFRPPRQPLASAILRWAGGLTYRDLKPKKFFLLKLLPCWWNIQDLEDGYKKKILHTLTTQYIWTLPIYCEIWARLQRFAPIQPQRRHYRCCVIGPPFSRCSSLSKKLLDRVEVRAPCKPIECFHHQTLKTHYAGRMNRSVHILLVT